MKHYCSLIKEVLRSKSAHAFYGSMTIKKRKEWHYNFLHNIKRFESEAMIISTYYTEFTLQPYSGMFYFFLLFEELTENDKLMTKVAKNITDFDLIVFLNVEKVVDPESYYDVNRMMKLQDKLTSEVGQILEQTVQRIKTLATQVNS
jgi:hypothetical protein